MEDSTASDRDIEIAVLISCLNEEQGIAGVATVTSFEIEIR